jgi:hypothetical protein
MNYKGLVRAAKVFFKEKYEPLLRKNFEGDVRRKEEQISQWEFWYMTHFTEGAEWANEQHAKEKQQWIEWAAEWLHNNVKNYIDYTEEGEIVFGENDMVIDFKKDVEKQI